MKSRLYVFSFVFLFPFLVFAQNVEGGLSFGLINYQGDLVEEIVEPSETNVSYGFLVRAMITERIGVRVNFLGGSLSGRDANFSNPTRAARGIRFRTPIYEFSVMGEWNLFAQDRTGIRGSVEAQRFTPYFYGGVGAVFFNPNVFKNDTKDPEGTDYETVSLSIPVGGGLKIGMTDRMVFSAEIGGRITLTDYLDGVSKFGNAGVKDYYWVGSFIFTYTFGQASFF